MTTKTIYCAYDGTEFDDEYKCLDYEVKSRFTNCIFLDENQKRIYLNEDTIEDIMFMHFNTSEELQDFIAICDDYGCSTPMLTPVEDILAPYDFYWDHNERCFIHYDERIRTLKEEVEELTNEKTKLFYNND